VGRSKTFFTAGRPVVLRPRFPHRQQTEDDDDHERDQEKLPRSTRY
jgi:hypothetical protein